MKKIGIVLGCLFLIAFITAYIDSEDEMEVQSGVAGDFSDEKEALEVKNVLQLNLKYAEDKDIEGYLTTISSSAHEDTEEAMSGFFNDFTVSHLLLEFEVIEQGQDELVAKAKQQTTGDTDLEDEEYRDHIADILHIFEKEDGNWKISESSVTNLVFID